MAINNGSLKRNSESQVYVVDKSITTFSTFDDLPHSGRFVLSVQPPSDSSQVYAAVYGRADYESASDIVSVGHIIGGLFHVRNLNSTGTVLLGIGVEGRVDATEGDITVVYANTVATSNNGDSNGAIANFTGYYVPDLSSTNPTTGYGHLAIRRAYWSEDPDAYSKLGPVTGATGQEIGTAPAVGTISSKYYMPFGVSGSAGAATTRSIAWATLFYCPERTTYTRIGVNVSTAVASTTVRLGIYKENSGPGALVVDGGTIDSSTTGDKEATISAALDAGLYWLVAQAEGGASDPSLLWGTVNDYRSIYPQSSSTSTDAVAYVVNTGALPDPFGSATFAGAGITPLIWLRVV